MDVAFSSKVQDLYYIICCSLFYILFQCAQWSSKSAKTKQLNLRPVQEDRLNFNTRSDQEQDGDVSDSGTLVPNMELTTTSEMDGNMEQSENSNNEQSEVEAGTCSDNSLNILCQSSKPKKAGK